MRVRLAPPLAPFPPQQPLFWLPTNPIITPLIWQTPGHFHPLGFQVEWSTWIKQQRLVIDLDHSSINFTLAICPWPLLPIPFFPRNHLSILGHIAFLESFSPLHSSCLDQGVILAAAPNSFVSAPFLASPSAYVHCQLFLSQGHPMAGLVDNDNAERK